MSRVITPRRLPMRAIAASAILVLASYSGAALAIDVACNPLRPLSCVPQFLGAEQIEGNAIVVRQNARAIVGTPSFGGTDDYAKPQYLHVNGNATVFEATNLHLVGEAGIRSDYGQGLLSVSDASRLQMSNSIIEGVGTDGLEQTAVHVYRRTRTEATNRPSTAYLNNVSIIGRGRAVMVTGASILEMTGGDITSTPGQREINAAVQVNDSVFRTNGTKITANENAVFVTTDVVLNPTDIHTSEITLAGSEIVTEYGSAIRADRLRLGADDTHMSVNLVDGTTVSAGNGVILEAGFDERYTRPFDLDVTVANSQLEGDFKFNTQVNSDMLVTNNGVVTGRIEGADLLRLENGGEWRLIEDTHAGNVQMAGGVIDVHGTAADGQYRTLDIDSLSGEGDFRMQTNLQTAESDRLNLKNGTATGNFRLAVTNTGAQAVVSTQELVHDYGGNAQFSVIGDTVDLGAYTYSLEKHEANGETIWELVRSGTSVSTDVVLGVVGALPTVWLGEITTLRIRMGEMRMHTPKDGGVWARTFGNRYDAKPAGGQDYSQNQYGVLIGADRAIAQTENGTWFAGAMAGTSSSALKFGVGSNGTVESYTLGG